MIPALRARFNAAWTPEAYARLLGRLQAQTGVSFGFKVAETPCFFRRALIGDIAEAGRELVEGFLQDHAARVAADEAVPEAYRGPGQEAFPTFVQVDFGLIRNAAGEVEPRLVELQAFPSLYALQHTLAHAYREVYGLPETLGIHLDGLDSASYLALLREALVGPHDPAEVVLMEVDPQQQKTLPDFVLTEQLWGVRAIDIADVEVSGRGLYYQRDGRRVRIKRIYNRVIPDELERLGRRPPFDYRDDHDVEWTGHPAWYFRLSKFAMPWLRHPVVPKTFFLHEVGRVPGDPSQFVLKPLFSFAGGGIVFDPTDADIAAIPPAQRHLYVLQERMAFAPIIDTPDGPTQVEVRVMYVHAQGRLRPVLPLLRMGRGKMMGVSHNKGLDWVGASAALLDE
jgi:hypothetical protein